jgi:flagellar biosynthesis chaperone FliJ
MPRALDSRERSEFRGLIGERFEADCKKIEAEYPEWEAELDDRLQKIAVGRLKVEKDVAELENIEEQLQALSDRKEQLESKIAKKMPFSKSKSRHAGTCRNRVSLCEAIDDIKDRVRSREYAKHPAAKKYSAAEEARGKRLAKLAGCTTREDVANSGILTEL